MNRVYFDRASLTPVMPEVRQAMEQATYMSYQT